ncbi:Thioesterase/thiol ester dehydrase-isomerase, partial [Pleurotus pulmonarius]
MSSLIRSSLSRAALGSLRRVSRPSASFSTASPSPSSSPSSGSQDSTSNGHQPQNRRGLSTTSTLLLASLLAATSYTIGSIFPPAPFTLLFPRAAPPPPSNPDSEDSKRYTQDLEAKLHALPSVQAHRAAEAQGWYETRPYANFPEERRVNNLTAGALRGPGKLALKPLVRARADETEACVWIHLGRGLCGHDGIVHGGLLATLLDETLARQAISNLPDKVGVTAQLSIGYKAPTRADQFILIKTKLVEAKGRKARVSGVVEDLEGNILVEATATFVQPRYAKLLKP